MPPDLPRSLRPLGTPLGTFSAKTVSTFLITGFVQLLEVLEKPWNLILDFKGA